MEKKKKPLLGETSSGARSSNETGRTAAYNRRSDAITRGSRYQKAAALVDLAEDGVGLPEQILERSSFESAAKFYFIYIQFDFLWTINYFAIIVLNFLEKPLWCSNNHSGHSCTDREYFYLGQLPYLTSAESLIFEGITLFILVAHVFFPISYEGSLIFWKNPRTRFKVICLSILVADFLVYTLYLSHVAIDYLPVRIAPYIRVILFILYIRGLQKVMVILAGMLGTYLNILAVCLLFLVFSSWVAYIMFEDTQQGELVFTSYGKTLYEMFILFTTSNNPDVWIPAYKASRWYCLFFVLYVLLAVYFITSLILAAVYDSFKGQLAKQVSQADRIKKSMLVKAFNLIDEYNVGYVNKDQCFRLLGELNRFRTLPKILKEEFEYIFEELDDTRDFKIDLNEFGDLCDVIAVRFQKDDIPSCFEYFPSIYHSPFSENLKAFARSRKFRYIIFFTLVVNLIAVIIETTLSRKNDSGQKLWQRIEFVFGWIYFLEMALKIYAFGFVNYWRHGRNRFDFLITWVIVTGETITFASPDGLIFLSNGEWIRYLLLARVLRLIRLFMYSTNYRAFVTTFLNLMQSLMPYLGSVFCVLCIYCSLGEQIFGGIVNAGNPNLQDTDLAEAEYLLFNFNDYPNGMVTLFNLLGNWLPWMQVVAFVLEAFFAEMELEKSGQWEDRAAKGAKPRRFGTKTFSQRVDILLHHILSSELDQNRS
ncbi:two pore calcium channel protein 1A isoform X2 [Ricinus communis]|uniref:two pore calcium channel protein 1A isoform X2 n=1 Tax=Ricinus communis TaxID=3988 RepID=UPI00201A2CF6|nr:two pore calcium channel protein 1A isoform X2 [Ricinus communis]